MNRKNKQRNILVIGMHQTYLKTYAGGYVRLKEFLKNFPKDFDYKLIDVSPTIYEDVIDKEKLILLKSPTSINFFLSLFFPLGVLLERIWMSFAIYAELKKHIEKEGSLIYVPIGELPHLYIPAIYLKRNYPGTKLVVDILNFRVINEGLIKLIKKLRKTDTLFNSFALGVVYYCMYMVIKKTVNEADYVFTVSKDLVKEIKKVYLKNTISFTPSGVDPNPSIPHKTKKKYLGVYVGRVTEQKGIYNLINVWKKIVKVKRNAKLAIAGFVDPYTESAIKKLVKDNHLEANIDVFGPVSEQKKYKIISEGKMFLHLANYEPLFPVIGILEGMICGLPCLVFDMPVLKDEVTTKIKNVFVFVAENGNLDEAAKKVLDYDRYVKNKKNKISFLSKQFAKKFDWKEISNVEVKVIRDLL